MNVRKHMSAPPITVLDDSDFKTALGLMQEHGIRRLPVVDARGLLVGIVAERDLVLAAGRYLTSPVDVARIMTRQVVTVGDTTSVVDAAMVMIERKIGGLPVVDPSRKLLGIITETDLFNALVAILRQEQPSAQLTKPQRVRPPPKKITARQKSASKRPAATKPKGKPKSAKPKSAKSKSDRKRPPTPRRRVKRVVSR
jgi:CBS-domain-containing membrane protein